MLIVVRSVPESTDRQLRIKIEGPEQGGGGRIRDRPLDLFVRGIPRYFTMSFTTVLPSVLVTWKR